MPLNFNGCCMDVAQIQSLWRWRWKLCCVCNTDMVYEIETQALASQVEQLWQLKWQNKLLNGHRHLLSFRWYSTKCCRHQNNLQRGCSTQLTVITVLFTQPQVRWEDDEMNHSTKDRSMRFNGYLHQLCNPCSHFLYHDCLELGFIYLACVSLQRKSLKMEPTAVHSAVKSFKCSLPSLSLPISRSNVLAQIAKSSAYRQEVSIAWTQLQCLWITWTTEHLCLLLHNWGGITKLSTG